ncbi:MAG TPA: Ldh family oxidoreductase [Solirubrobacterales bacterium]|nr:Ldh family oxidoreductase [Solirubrobacterales bacterium]
MSMPAELRRFAEEALVAAGARPADAACTADCLLEADLRGVHSHGLVRLPSYVAQAKAGEIDLRAEPTLGEGEGPTGHVDAHRCLGAVSSGLAMREAIARARRHGIGAVSVREGTHFGSAAHYTLMAARAGLVGVTATNTPAVMAPWGGSQAVLGNNPLSIAAPAAGSRPPFVLDMAQSAAARGKIRLAEEAGLPIPSGWALGPDGAPTTDPTLALDGALLSFGGHKGTALALGVEILTAVACGADLSYEMVNTGFTGRVAPGGRTGGVGAFHLALDPIALGARDDFPERVAALAGVVEAVPEAPGSGSAPAFPGTPEAAMAERALVDGLDLPAATVEGLDGLAEELGIAPSRSLRGATDEKEPGCR